MMGLDEAIQHCLEVAEKQEKLAENSMNIQIKKYKVYDADEYIKCKECAEEHRQLAEWLKYYKRLLAIESGIDVRCGNCKHDGIDSDRCEECYWYNKWEEVKSDEETKRP